MPNLTPRELYRILLKAGWGKDAEKAFKVVYLESTLDPTIINPADPEPDGTPGEAYGLFQIHSQHIKNLEKEFGDEIIKQVVGDEDFGGLLVSDRFGTQYGNNDVKTLKNEMLKRLIKNLIYVFILY